MSESDDVEQQLEELVDAMDGYNTTIPTEVIQYYLEKSGFQTSDEDVLKLVNVATQKFIYDLALDSIHYTKIREQRETGRSKTKATHRRVLKVEDVQQSLEQYGIHVNKPEYFTDSVDAGVVEEEED
eukprot:TRINITY_DN1364_c1_g2_i3.p1 TRINITY_DN1364_c1_g2~~TRINITY_DN1364_c1_g2_i3.p1  ORF type:complete len:135 (-),score=46.69 TRINITY_DN1364_c1_g2_i3:51-431(-)